MLPSNYEFIVRTFSCFAVVSKYKRANTSSQRRILRRELKLRTAHNQCRVISLQQNICCFLKQKFKEEFNNLFRTIPKLYKFLIYCKQNTQNYDRLSCPEDILNLDLTHSVRECLSCEMLDIRLMSLFENYKYRELIKNENRSNQEKLIGIDDFEKMEEDERERLVFRPYHDQDINT